MAKVGMDKLSPGSEEAQKQGCICPVVDNHYGDGIPDCKGGRYFWMVEDCPLHGSQEKEQEVEAYNHCL